MILHVLFALAPKLIKFTRKDEKFLHDDMLTLAFCHAILLAIGY